MTNPLTDYVPARRSLFVSHDDEYVCIVCLKKIPHPYDSSGKSIHIDSHEDGSPVCFLDEREGIRFIQQTGAELL